MMKKKKIRIIKIPFIDLKMGLYFLGTNTIILNKRLDKYPKLKKLVLEHETKHFEEKTLLNAIKRDYMDAYRIYNHPEFFAFFNETKQRKNQELLILKRVFYFFVTFPLIFIQTYCMLKNSLKMIFRWEK